MRKAHEYQIQTKKIVRYCYLLFDIRIFDQTYNTKDNTVQSLLITFAEVNAHSLSIDFNFITILITTGIVHKLFREKCTKFSSLLGVNKPVVTNNGINSNFFFILNFFFF